NEDVGPTPETAAKLERDVLQSLTEAGQITAEHEYAGRELHAMWRALQRGMLPQLKLGRAGPAPGRKQVRSPFTRMHEREMEIWTTRYKPWADAQSKIVVARRPRLSRLDLALKVIDDNVALSCIAHRHALSVARVAEELRNALDLYCVLRRVKKLLT
ncbi:MAG: hypothetical protein RLN70_12080, partial [Rhodospirillaceae bacterium]